MTRKSLILILFLYFLTCFGGNNISVLGQRNRAQQKPSKLDGTCAPPEIENGKFSVLSENYEEGSPIPDSVAMQISCKKYFGLYPQSSYIVVCLKGNWSAPLPKCIHTCRPLASTSVDVSCTFDGTFVDCAKPMLDGTVANSTCKRFYMSTDATQLPTITCRNGTWDGALINCKPDCGEVASEGAVHVVGGEKSKQGEFPWHIALYRNANKTGEYKYKCGGSIISTYVVITAAHCVTNILKGERIPAEEFYIGAGKYYSAYNAPEDTFAQMRQVKDFYIPPSYKASESNYAGDLAVVVIKEAFELTNYVRPVCVEWNVKFDAEQLISVNGSVPGWGYVNPKNKMVSEELRKLTAPFIDVAACLDAVPEKFRRWITPDKFCAGYTNGTSVCGGDSGGGMVFPWKTYNKERYYLRGVVSVGPLKDGTCDEHHYGVYTRISYYTSYIQEIMRDKTPRDSRTDNTGYGYCSEPEIKNGKFDLLNTKYEKGFPIPNYSILAVHCDENYGLYPKVPYLFCINGTWNAPKLECKKTCPFSYYVKNCKMNGIEIPCFDYEALMEGAQVEAICRNNIISQCIDGMWNEPLSYCPGYYGSPGASAIRLQYIDCLIRSSTFKENCAEILAKTAFLPQH